MKKLFLLSLVAMAFVIVPFQETKAQKSFYTYSAQPKTAAGVNKSTLTNIDTSYTAIPLEVSNTSVKVVITRSSGNNSKVKVVLQGRYGAASTTFGSASDGNWTGIDSLTGSNGTYWKNMELKKNGDFQFSEYRFYNISDTSGTGAQASTLSQYYLRVKK